MQSPTLQPMRGKEGNVTRQARPLKAAAKPGKVQSQIRDATGRLMKSGTMRKATRRPCSARRRGASRSGPIVT